MEAEQDQGEDVPEGNPPHAEPGHHVLVDLALNKARFGMDVASGELQQVKDDEGQHDRAAPVHGAVGVIRIDGLLDLVADRPRFLVAQGQLNRGYDVQDDAENEHAANQPQQFAEILEEVAVGVEPVGTVEDLQIAEQMADDEQEQNDACYRHHGLLAIRGLPEAWRPVRLRASHGGAHRACLSGLITWDGFLICS